MGGPKTSIMDAMSPHCGKPLLLKMDMENFYPNISAKQVERLFQSILDEPHKAKDFARLCTTEGGLPQGAPTSPVLARMIFEPAFIDLKRALKAMHSDCAVTIWVDDLNISGPMGIKRSMRTIGKILQRHGFKLNPSKTKIQTTRGQQSGLGLNVGNYLTPDDATMTRYKVCRQHTPWNLKSIRGFENYFNDIRKANIRLAKKRDNQRTATTAPTP